MIVHGFIACSLKNIFFLMFACVYASRYDDGSVSTYARARYDVAWILVEENPRARITTHACTLRSIFMVVVVISVR